MGSSNKAEISATQDMMVASFDALAANGQVALSNGGEIIVN